MKGVILTGQKCSECGGSLKYREGTGIMQCPDHPGQVWVQNCRVRFGRDHQKRFKSVRDAERHLTYLRAQTDHGVFDARDWNKDSPLALSKLIDSYLDKKKLGNLGDKQLRHITYVLGLAVKKWGDVNIKEIGEGEVEDFLLDDKLKIGNKTRHNYKSALSDFWTWVVRREKRKSGIEMVEFPDISFELGWRKITDIKTQEKIIEEIKQISYKVNPRIWIGVRLLAFYPMIRPKELINIEECHINLDSGWIVFPSPKEKKPKFCLLDSEHIDLIQEHWEVRAMPTMHWFRHLKGGSGIQKDDQFGPRYLKKWWDRACDNLGVEGVGLYAGTKHTSVTALGELMSPEEIQRGATGHASDAFKRYMLPNDAEKVKANQAARKLRKAKGGQRVANISGYKRQS